MGASNSESEGRWTHKMEQFCQEYLVDFNGLQAAIRAGYSPDSAGSIAHENLNKPQIKNRIDELLEDRAKRVAITADRVLAGLAEMAFADMRDLFDEDGKFKPISSLTKAQAACLAGFEVSEVGLVDNGGKATVERVKRIKLSDRRAALELLGKHLKLFTDKSEISGPEGGPVQVDCTVKVVNAPAQAKPEHRDN